MFKLKYNILAVIQTALGLLNYLLFIKVFGVSDLTDAYFITMAIISSAYLLQMQFVEQFVIFYHEEKLKNKKNAHKFYKSCLSLSMLIGGIFYFLGVVIGDYFVSFFTTDMDNMRLELIQSYFSIALLEIILLPILYINQKVLNAEMLFSKPYVLTIIPNVILLISILILFFYKSLNIEVIIYGKVIGVYLSVFISFFFIKSLHISILPTLYHPSVCSYIRNSFTMKFSHNVHNLFFIVLTTNLLTTLPIGHATFYYYAHKMAGIVSAISVGPSLNALNAKLSYAWSKKCYKMCFRYIIIFLKRGIPIFIGIALLMGISIPFVLPIINSLLSNNDIQFIHLLFFLILIWQFIIFIESGYVSILIVAKKSFTFFTTNLLYIILYYIFSSAFLSYFGVYSVPFSAMLAQLMSLFVYKFKASHLLKMESVSVT